MGLLETIRRWVDGEDSPDPVAKAEEQARPRRVWEDFLVKVAREIEAVMQREMFTPPGGQTFIPPEYIVYLSAEDDKEWQGDKRRGLEQGLYYVLSERAKELTGKTKLHTKQFAVELRVDGTLEKGQFRVQPVWDVEQSTTQTQVTPRAAGAESIVEILSEETGDATDTIENAEREVTQVRPRVENLYSLEIWRNGVRQKVAPVVKPEITIGRGSRSVAVDVAIKGDAEVSRLHVVLEKDAENRFWLTSKGRNSTFIKGDSEPREAPREERIQVAPDEKIEIGSYTLRIQP
ncbi:MAG: hypothetical protein NVSMB56_16680 [Pyrinomonadaceae bacterium]